MLRIGLTALGLITIWDLFGNRSLDREWHQFGNILNTYVFFLILWIRREIPLRIDSTVYNTLQRRYQILIHLNYRSDCSSFPTRNAEWDFTCVPFLPQAKRQQNFKPGHCTNVSQILRNSQFKTSKKQNRIYLHASNPSRPENQNRGLKRKEKHAKVRTCRSNIRNSDELGYMS